MASIALDPAYRRISVEEFLAMDLGDAKAELEDGLIYMMTGGTSLHAQIAGNIYFALRTVLNGSGCRTYGSDLGVRTGERNVRFPDVSVYCGRELSPAEKLRQLIGDPQVVIEVLSPSTASHDQKTKLEEYRLLPGVREIVFVDPASEAIRLVARMNENGWTDVWLDTHEDLTIPSLGVTLPRSEIFAN